MESISRQIDQPKNKKKRISWIENHAEKLLPSKSNIEKIANEHNSRTSVTQLRGKIYKSERKGTVTENLFNGSIAENSPILGK